MNWYIMIDNEQYGPYSLDQLVSYIKEGRIQPGHLAWHANLPDWMKVEELEGLKTYFPLETKKAGGKPRNWRNRRFAYCFVLVVLFLASLVFLGFRTFSFLQDDGRTVSDPVARHVTSSGLYLADNVKLGSLKIPFTRLFGDDTTGDGYPDRRSYYRDDVLVLAAWDTNRDGSTNLWFRFVDGDYVDLEAYDLTGDGKIDQLIRVDENEAVISMELMEAKEVLPAALAQGPLLLLPILFLVLLVLSNLGKRRQNSALCLLLILSIVFTPLASLPAARAQELCNEDGTFNEAVFEREWQKYSAFDEEIPMESRSWEVQQYFGVQDRINQLDYEAFELGIAMEYDRQLRLELREVKASLVNNIRDNLVKSVFRLSFLTADAIKTGYGLGQKYAKLFSIKAIKATAELADAISYLNDALEVVTSLTPDNVKEPSELSKEIKHYESLRDDAIKITENPANVAGIAANRVVKAAEDKLGQIFPSVSDMKFSEEEVEILRSQNLRNRLIDDILMESYRENSERRMRIAAIHMQISDLVGEQQQWVREEKERVRYLLEESCRLEKDGKNGDDDAEDTGEDNGGASQDNGTIQPPVGEPLAAGGLSGIWLGSGAYFEISDTTGWDEEMRKAHLGTTRPMGISIGRDERGNHFVYDRETQVILLDVPAGPTFPLYLDDRKVSFVYEGKDPTGEVDIYWAFNGEVDANFTVITGTSELGSIAMGGKLFILRTTMSKQ